MLSPLVLLTALLLSSSTLTLALPTPSTATGLERRHLQGGEMGDGGPPGVLAAGLKRRQPSPAPQGDEGEGLHGPDED